MNDELLWLSDKIRQAHAQLHTHFIKTPLIHDAKHSLWLKCENLQRTGSFKWRGAVTKLSNIPAGKQIVTASTGNHGLAIATASQIFHLQPVIFVPKSAARTKTDKIRRTGATIITVEGDSLTAELAGKDYAAMHDLPWISPYNDYEVISGQGTIAIELLEAFSHIDRVYITVGGGGLVSGVSALLKDIFPSIEIIGCQPENSPEMYVSVQAGRVVQDPHARETLSDGSAGPLEEDSVTFPIARKLIDRFLLIAEADIRMAVKYLNDAHGQVAEGAAGVAMAAAMKDNSGKPGTAVVILCGGNIDDQLHAAICADNLS